MRPAFQWMVVGGVGREEQGMERWVPEQVAEHGMGEELAQPRLEDGVQVQLAGRAGGDGGGEAVEGRGLKRPHGNQETVSEPSRANARTHLLTVILTT